MLHSIKRVSLNPKKYRQCELCGGLNLVNNDSCKHCGNKAIQESAIMTDDHMKSWVDDEFAFWSEVEDYTYEQFWAILLEV